MKITQPDKYGYQRTLSFTNIPEVNPDGTHNNVRELTVQIQYLERENDGSRVEKAITLDHCIIPLLARSTAMEEALCKILTTVEWHGANSVDIGDLAFLKTLRTYAMQGLVPHKQQA